MTGYIKDHRKELDSKIWLMPPLYHRVWQYLKYKVNHETGEIPMRDGSTFTVEPGQHLTSIRQIAKGVGWYEGRAWKEPNPKTIDSILKWLEANNMILIFCDKGNRGGTLVTLINWASYQHETVSSNNKVTVEKQSMETNNNNKELFSASAASAETEIVIEPSEINRKAKEVEDHFIRKRGQGVDITSEDYSELRKAIADGVSVDILKAGIDVSFAKYKPKHRLDRIRNLTYCLPLCYDMWVKSITENVPSEPVALGSSVTHLRAVGESRPRTSSKSYQSRQEAQSDQLMREIQEEEARARNRPQEIILDHRQHVPQFRRE